MAWGILRPSDWKSVIRQDGDEVGVFLRQDSLDLPYEPNVENKKAGNQRSKVRVLQQIGMLIIVLIPPGATITAQ